MSWMPAASTSAALSARLGAVERLAAAWPAARAASACRQRRRAVAARRRPAARASRRARRRCRRRTCRFIACAISRQLAARCVGRGLDACALDAEHARIALAPPRRRAAAASSGSLRSRASVISLAAQRQPAQALAGCRSARCRRLARRAGACSAAASSGRPQDLATPRPRSSKLRPSTLSEPPLRCRAGGRACRGSASTPRTWRASSGK